MNERVFDSASPAETERIAERLGAQVRGGDVVLLDGELGAGKTCFTRGLARGAGADARAVSSPTYVIAQEYSGAGVTLVHVDAYRLGAEDDLESVGVDTGGGADDVVLVVEWASRLWDQPPVGALRVRIDHSGGDERRLTFSGDDGWASRIENL